jgi:hypothetical protein
MSPQKGSGPVVPAVSVVASVSPTVSAEVVVPEAEADIDPPVAVDDPADADVVALVPEAVGPVAVPVVAVSAAELPLVEPPPLQPTVKTNIMARVGVYRVTDPGTDACLEFPTWLSGYIHFLAGPTRCQSRARGVHRADSSEAAARRERY